MVRRLLCHSLPFLQGHHQYFAAEEKIARTGSLDPLPGSMGADRRIWTSRTPLCQTYSMMRTHDFSLRPPSAWTNVRESSHSDQTPSSPSLSQVEAPPPNLLELPVPLSSV